MEHIIFITISGFLVAAVSISGLLIIKSNQRLAHAIERNLGALAAASAGVFLVTSYLLIHETLEVLPTEGSIIAFVIGILAYIFLHHVIAPHRHHGVCHDHRHEHDSRSAWKLLIGDAVHNVADGLLLVTSFGAGTSVGIATTLSIALHEVPQEIAEFFVLRKSGYTNTEATYRNVATAMSIFLGIGLGVLLASTEVIQGYLLGATATFFLGIVFTDLFPLREVVVRKDAPRLVAALLTGIIIMTGISSLFSHDHHEPDNYVDEHQDL